MIGSDDDYQALDLLIRGYQISRAIRLVADLRIADDVTPEAAVSVTDLASASGVEAPQLLRVVRALAAFGIFRIDSDGMVTHTSRSLLLRSYVPNSLHHAARFWTAPGTWRAWDSVDTALHGKVPYEVAWGTSRFDYLRDNPDEARVFDAFMAKTHDNRHAVIAETYDFSRARLIADIGGGNGEALRRILTLHPEVRGIVFDRVHVVAAIAPEALAGGHITTQSGSFFDAVPEGADIYMLVRVLHDWSDEDASSILRSCRNAMQDDARLLVVETVMPSDPMLGDWSEYLIDLQMMVMFRGARERTEPEFRNLLAGAGLELARVIPTSSTVSILEAVVPWQG
jgi:hypothetical protein